jgi:hypothetical protein
MSKLENKERILKSASEKCQLTYKGKHKRVISDLLAHTLKGRKAWSNVVQALRKNNFQPRILYSAKVFFYLDGKIRTFQDKSKLELFACTKLALQRILKGIIHTEEDEKQS